MDRRQKLALIQAALPKSPAELEMIETAALMLHNNIAPTAIAKQLGLPLGTILQWAVSDPTLSAKMQQYKDALVLRGQLTALQRAADIIEAQADDALDADLAPKDRNSAAKTVLDYTGIKPPDVKASPVTVNIDNKSEEWRDRRDRIRAQAASERKAQAITIETDSSDV